LEAEKLEIRFIFFFNFSIAKTLQISFEIHLKQEKILTKLKNLSKSLVVEVSQSSLFCSMPQALFTSFSLKKELKVVKNYLQGKTRKVFF
jgi:hypothetical protein